jgi:hypothetical protein
MIKPRTSKKSIKKSMMMRWLLIGGSAILLLLAAIVFVLGYTGSAKPIKDVASQLQIPSNWHLRSEQVEPPRLLCLGDTSCPELNRSWLANSTSLSEIETIFKNTGWSYELDDSCKSMEKNLDNPSVDFICNVDARTDHYRMSFYIEHYDRTHQLLISLFIKPQ